MLLSDAIDEYGKMRQRQVKPITATQDANTCRILLAHVGNIQLKNLKASHLEDFFYGENGYADKVQPSTFNNVLNKIRGFLRWCERRGYLRRDLLEEIRAMKTIKKERMRLSPSQLMGMLELVDHPRDRMILALAINTGLRASDIVRLKVADVNLESATLHCIIGKSDLEDNKPITKELDQELRRWLLYYEAAPKDTYRQKLQPGWFLVPSLRRWDLPSLGGRLPDGGGVITTDNRNFGECLFPEAKCKTPARGVKRALAKMDLDGPGEGLHTIRRSVARAYFESLRAQGYDGALQATKAFLNHADSKITENYLGLTHERQIRDESLAGKPFLSAMVEGENVVRIADARREA